MRVNSIICRTPSDPKTHFKRLVVIGQSYIRIGCTRFPRARFRSEVGPVLRGEENSAVLGVLDVFGNEADRTIEVHATRTGLLYEGVIYPWRGLERILQSMKRPRKKGKKK